MLLCSTSSRSSHCLWPSPVSGRAACSARARKAAACASRRRAAAGVPGQTFGRELADRLQHQVTRSSRRWQLAEQALIHQFLQAIQHRPASIGLRTDGLDDIQGHAAPEHRTGGQQTPGLLAEQVVAPLDGGAQSLLTAGQVTAPAGQQPQRMLQPPADRLRRQQLDPRRGQLDRQRQPVKPAHDLGDRGGVLLVNGETRRHGRGPLSEQPHRFTRSHRGERDLRLLVRERQRGNRAFLLARHPKRRPAAHHDPQTTGTAQQFRHDRSGRAADARNCPTRSGASGPAGNSPGAAPAAGPADPAIRCPGRSTRAPIPDPAPAPAGQNTPRRDNRLPRPQPAQWTDASCRCHQARSA